MDANIRLKLPAPPGKIESDASISFSWDELSGTVLLKYMSNPDGTEIIAGF